MDKAKQNIYLRAPDELKEKLKQKAEHMGLSLHALILQVLWEFAAKA